jgi:ABC-2 type transport system ATP-binding protein
LFLDEPTSGLDPNARQDVWRMIRAWADAGVTVILTTQYLEEADQLADRIAVIDHGRKIAEGTSRELKSAVGAGCLHVAIADPSRLDEAARLLQARLGASAQRSPERAELSIITRSPAEASGALSQLMEGPTKASTSGTAMIRAVSITQPASLRGSSTFWVPAPSRGPSTLIAGTSRRRRLSLRG